MPDIIIAILIIIVLVASISGLLYVGSKFLLNVSTDISNIPKQTNASNTPTLPNVPNVPQISTSVLPYNTLEAWSQNNFQGNKILSLSLASLNDGYNIRAVSGITSIRFPSTGYDVYIMTQQQYETAVTNDISNNYKNYSTKINSNSPSLSVSVSFIVIIKSSPPINSIPTTTTRMGNNYTEFTNSLCAIDSSGKSPYVYGSFQDKGVCRTLCNNNPLCSGYMTNPFNSQVDICTLYGTNKEPTGVFTQTMSDVPFSAGERVTVGYPYKYNNSNYTCYIRNNA